jgi:hypothetical protein
LFCTICDVRYLPRVLTLRASLLEHSPDARLVVLVVDDSARSVLERLDVDTVDIRELEEYDSDLARVRPTRNTVEYCWTAKAPFCRFVMERYPDAVSVTYVDGDLMFFGSPRELLDRHRTESILLVPHRYASSWERYNELSGIFNGGFISFRPGADTRDVLARWREQCLEWCFDRFEGGRFSDQKYLDDWPTRYDGVGVVTDPAVGLAPWNASASALSADGATVLVDGAPLVFYHYHGLRLFRGAARLRRIGLLADQYRLTRTSGRPLVWQATHPIGARELELVWTPYLRRLAGEAEPVRRVDPAAARAAFRNVRLRAAAAATARRFASR